MHMTNIDIIAAYREANNKSKIVSELALANDCSTDLILSIIKEDMEVKTEVTIATFTQEQKDEIIKRYSRSGGHPATVKTLMGKFKCEEEDIKIIMREYARTFNKTPGKDNTSSSAESVSEPIDPETVEEPCHQCDLEPPPCTESEDDSDDRSNEELAAINDMADELLVVSKPKKKRGRKKMEDSSEKTSEVKRQYRTKNFDKKWYDAQRDLDSGESEEVVSERYECSVATLRRMLGRLRNQSEKIESEDIKSEELTEPEVVHYDEEECKNGVYVDRNSSSTVTETIREELKKDPKTGPDRLKELIDEGHFEEFDPSKVDGCTVCNIHPCICRLEEAEQFLIQESFKVLAKTTYEKDPDFKENFSVDESQIHPDPVPEDESHEHHSPAFIYADTPGVEIPAQVYEDIKGMNYMPSADPNIFENMQKEIKGNTVVEFMNNQPVENHRMLSPEEMKAWDGKGPWPKVEVKGAGIGFDKFYDDMIEKPSKKYEMDNRIPLIASLINDNDSNTIKRLVGELVVEMCRQDMINHLGIKL